MSFRFVAAFALCGALALGVTDAAIAQGGGSAQSEHSAMQRLEIMRSKLEAMRRSLNSAISSMEATDKEKRSADDPRERLRGLDKEVGSILSEVSEIRAKQERSERYDTTILDRLETSVTDIDARVQAGLQATASERTVGSGATARITPKKKKKKGRFFGLLGGGGDDKYEELTGAIAPGRDRVLFEEAAREVRKGSHETGRLLFTTIINTYPDSPFLPLAKLAIADSFYLEGSTSALIQAAQAYQDWLTFFPTDPLAPNAMLKVAEAEMRQMGLPDREITPARKAEQRLKALLQQHPQTKLRPEVEQRLKEVQENLAMHHLQIGNFYYKARFEQGKGGLKGAQSRFKEIVEKYPSFSYMDEVLFRLATTYQHEEEPDEAAKFYQQLLREHPNSEYSEKAREQLEIIGLPIPEPDPDKLNAARPDRPTFMGNLMQQVTGRADVTVSKNGILISKDGKEGSDLIDEALKHNGQLPATTTPQTPTTVDQGSQQGPTQGSTQPGAAANRTGATSGSRP
ncbi:MAG TPA: outer membrane protein assembly factor BamD [Pyrinomonadaceae bacterium]|nr:outer membrane protein assembly factor BamD [Pyrinomonadaceae bacterium]